MTHVPVDTHVLKLHLAGIFRTPLIPSDMLSIMLCMGLDTPGFSSATWLVHRGVRGGSEGDQRGVESRMGSVRRGVRWGARWGVTTVGCPSSDAVRRCIMPVGIHAVGPAGSCVPCHMVPINSRNEGLKTR